MSAKRITNTDNHETVLTLLISPSKGVEPGSPLEAHVTAQCPSGCDLTGSVLHLFADGSLVADDIVLTKYDGTTNISDRFVLDAPEIPDTYTLTVQFPDSPTDSGHPGGTSGSAEVTVDPYNISISVWDISAPVEVGGTIAATIGAKSSAGYSLAGQNIEIHDQDGQRLVTQLLKEQVYSETVDLYWTEVTLPAPKEVGSYSWTAILPEPRLDLPHTPGKWTFSVPVTLPPEHTLTVKVYKKDSRQPIEKAWVVVKPYLYQAYTDENGMASLNIPSGTHEITITADEKAPVGLPYDIGGAPRVTSGIEYTVYIPESNLETFEPFTQGLTIDSDQALDVELVGVIEPPEPDIL